MQQRTPAETADIISANWRRVQQEVAEALDAAQRRDHVAIVGVTKYVGPALASQLVDAGCQLLGENRPQSLWDKHQWFLDAGRSQPSWHLIGHLQRNKVRRTLPLVDCLQSVDSLRLAQAVSQEAARVGRLLPVLVEVNVTLDTSKTGMPIAEVHDFFQQACELPGIRIEGLMAMSSQLAGGDQARREFARVRELKEQLQEQFAATELRHLSMGMSVDFREAIAEGSTLVRIGSSLWEGIVL
jgi:pyridoxal phosphate enzyme (YggS family)